MQKTIEECIPALYGENHKRKSIGKEYTVKPTPEQEIRKALSDLPAEDVEAVVTLVNSLCQKRTAAMVSAETEMSSTEHARLLSALDQVAALSSEQGPAVSNRDHDRYLYGN
jgi:hypothetical protein